MAPAAANDDAFSLASLNTSFIGDNSAKIGANGSTNANTSSNTSNSTSNSDIYSTPSRPTSQKVQTTPLAQSAPTRSPRNTGNASGASTPKSYELWERTAVSRTGTCLALSAGAYYRQQGRQSAEKSLSR